MNISWESAESHLLLNSTYSKEEQERFQVILKEGSAWPGHLWLSTSGSVSPKWVGLSKQAILASAASVNKHLDSGPDDCWVNPLPDFHVGGLGIWARAYLSGAKVQDYRQFHSGKWQAEEFYCFLREKRGTLTSLVPAQLHDLVQLGLNAPPDLRAVIIGGGALLPALYEKGIALGWPLLPSYGLTECASQVATAPLEGRKRESLPRLQLLSHLKCRVQEGRLFFAGSSLLSTYAYLEGSGIRFADPKVGGWLMSEDRGTIENDMLTPLGRADAICKVGGENVDLAILENRLQSLKLHLSLKADATLVAMEDPRLGSSIHLASDSANEELLQPLVEAFQKSVLPFERIRKIHLLKELPRSSLGKILTKELIALIKKEQ